MVKKISVILGTRPEAIKLAPIILKLKNDSRFVCNICVTGQHREMLDQVLDVFRIVPNVDLKLMRNNQTLDSFTALAIAELGGYFDKEKPDLILVQGDTTTVFCASLVAFYHRIPIGHVEAGLRTGDILAPWPEEANRVLTSRIASLHFAPTDISRNNLLREGISADKIFVTGNSVIDALYIALEKVQMRSLFIEGLPNEIQPFSDSTRNKLVLITGHRRESFGRGFENICKAISELALKFPNIHFVYPVHLNPNVRETVMSILGKDKSGLKNEYLTNVHLIDPLSYLPFVALMNRSYLILTDSGGIQEEAPSLGKPVLVMRETTERPEAVSMGTVKLVGTDYNKIVENVTSLLEDNSKYALMANAINPYGDGSAGERIIEVCARYLGFSK